MFLIRTINLCQRYGEKEVLRNINIEVARGEIFAVIGPTGAGKTTLLRLLDLLELPTSGQIYFDGVPVTNSNKMWLKIRRRMAMVLQKPVVFKTSVYDNIACGLRFRREERGRIHEKVSNLLDMVSLSAYKQRKAWTLSGGEAQRVALARAMVIEPEVLLLDEPTANLDPVSAATINELILRFNREYETTIIVATHDLSQGQKLADRIVVLMNGQVVQTGKPKEIFDSPKSTEVAQLVGVENIISGTIRANEGGMVTVDIGGNTIEGVADYVGGEDVYVCIRPEDITLALSRTVSSARNSLTGQIKRIALSEPLARIEVDCGFPLVALLTRKSAEEMGLQIGRVVYASFKATAIHVIKRSAN